MSDEPDVRRDLPAPGKVKAARLKGQEYADRARVSAEKVRDEIPAANAGWEAYVEDAEFGGPLISGAIAFRLFLWLLPFTLVTTVGFGLLASAGGTDAESLARTAGVRGLAAQQISAATDTSTRTRWFLVGLGLVALVSTSNALSKAMWRSHEIAWRLPRVKPPNRWKATAGVVGLTAVGFALSGGAAWLRDRSPTLGIGVILLLFATWAALWVGASMILPHGDAPWTALVPGAILFAACTEVLRLFTIYYVARKVTSSSALYGGLGAAAALLTWMYLLARTVTAAAILNSTLWKRRSRGTGSGIRRVPPQ